MKINESINSIVSSLSLSLFLSFCLSFLLIIDEQDMDDRSRMLKMRMGQLPPAYSMGGGGNGSGGEGGSSSRSWRMYSGHSDNDLPPQRHSAARGSYSKGVAHSRGVRSLSGVSSERKILSPDREGPGGGGDSDVESLVSFVSGTSALSTQSERPAAYMKRSTG